LTFELKPERLAITDSKGRDLLSVAAVPVSIDQAERLQEQALDAENRLLVAMQRRPGASVADLATAAGMTLGAGQPNKRKAHALLQKLAESGLVQQDRSGRYRLTGKGRNAADEVSA
jgi:predicted transcriptional regulator